MPCLGGNAVVHFAHGFQTGSFNHTRNGKNRRCEEAYAVVGLVSVPAGALLWLSAASYAVPHGRLHTIGLLGASGAGVTGNLSGDRRAGAA